ncbi:hypothetical protein RRF57_013155 [Xylaria bambusicola]|uniref:Copper acquisition factor BIM1-like domain-containing protein n=1 Tax=Xylaria bambusicola TaxID=326684 RepID=A0AAN7UR60_9PEZI
MKSDGFETQFSRGGGLNIGSVYATAEDDKAHGEGAEGTVQGPVAFLWPENRPWSANTDNSGPCGSPNGVINRTSFPLSQGSVALTIADEAWNVAFSVAYDNDPTVQTQFVQQLASVAVVESGHQCYKIDDIPNTVVAGSNATIQMKYWSNIDNELGGHNQTFFACADIQVTSRLKYLVSMSHILTSTCLVLHPPRQQVSPKTLVSKVTQPKTLALNPIRRLTKGAIAGVAVGVVLASLLVIGVVAFFVLRGRKSQILDNVPQQDGRKVTAEVASVNSRP